MPRALFRLQNRLVIELYPIPSASQAQALLERLKGLCRHHNPEYDNWLAFRRGKRGRPPPKVVETWGEHTGGISLPSGRLLEAKEIATDLCFDVEVIDQRYVGPTHGFRWAGPELWDHQARLIDGVHERLRVDLDRGCFVWRSPPGSGKSVCSVAIACELGLSTLIVAPTATIFRQWADTVKHCLGIEPGMIGDGQQSRGLITIITQDSAWRRAEFLAGKFGLVICDELQRHGAATMQKFADATRARYRIGVSANEKRADKKQYLIYDQFGSDAQVISKDELQRTGEIVPVSIVVVPTKFRADWYKKLAPDVKFLERSKLIDRMCSDEERNATIEQVAESCTDQALVICQRVEHAHSLCGRLGSALPLLGKGNNGEGDFEANKQAFARGEVRYAVGVAQTVGVGFESHKALANVILTMPVVVNDQSRMQVEQFTDRAARSAPGKKRGVAYYLLDENVFGLNPLRLLNRWYPDVTVLVDGRLVPAKGYINDRRAALP